MTINSNYSLHFRRIRARILVTSTEQRMLATAVPTTKPITEYWCDGGISAKNSSLDLPSKISLLCYDTKVLYIAANFKSKVVTTGDCITL